MYCVIIYRSYTFDHGSSFWSTRYYVLSSPTTQVSKFINISTIHETNCNCCTAVCLLTVVYVLIIICVAIFYGQFFNLLGQSFSEPPMPTHNQLFQKIQSHQHLEECNITIFQVWWVRGNNLFSSEMT